MTIRLHLDFQPHATHIALAKKQAHYLEKVLRLKHNDKLVIFNGIDGEFEAEFLKTGSNCHLQIIKKTRDFIRPLNLTLCYAPVKNVKTDFIAKKAAELGITSIQPIITEYTIVRKVNLEKLNLSMIEGIEQCGRIDVLDIHNEIALPKFLKHNPDKLMLFFDETGSGKTPNQLKSDLGRITNQEIAILIGPEGGFSKQEAELINAMPQTLNISLGHRILRADTAIIAAATIVNSYCRDWL
ncbi:RsmE family RNA methyltransferase [Rickettsiales bacterium]|nr:RsmE family RNA methyltransferase [Rickettsiales bacterium]